MGDPLARSSWMGKERHFQRTELSHALPKLMPKGEDREQRRGEACPPRRAAGEAGGHYPSVTPCFQHRLMISISY
jgi:hypothetical protein